MKERPILFSAPMVRAILEGRKTMTRRVVKLRHGADVVVTNGQVWKPARVDYAGYVDCPYGQVGDRLWVREAWRTVAEANDLAPRDLSAAHRFWHEADAPHQLGYGKLRPSIHMPRWASRILLEVTGVRVERLNDISDVDSLSEGITSVRSNEFDVEHFKDWKERFDTAVASGEKPPVGPSPKESFKALWESINGSGSWEANQFVWVISFKRIDNA